MQVGLEQRRPLARAEHLDHVEELPQLLRLAECECGLERFDETELDGEKRDAELVTHGEHRLGPLDRLAESPFLPQDRRLCDPKRCADLDVLGGLQDGGIELCLRAKRVATLGVDGCEVG